MKHVKNITESFNKNVKTFKANEICTTLYDILKNLINKDYIIVYNNVYNNYDMFYQMFKSDEDTMKFINNIKNATDNKDFNAIYEPINKIITKLIDSNYK